MNQASNGNTSPSKNLSEETEFNRIVLILDEQLSRLEEHVSRLDSKLHAIKMTAIPVSDKNPESTNRSESDFVSYINVGLTRFEVLNYRLVEINEKLSGLI